MNGEEGDAKCSAEPKSKTALSSAAPTVPPASAASYFDNPNAARQLRKEAVSWIGTPFMQYYQQEIPEGADLRGMGGGIDCIGLTQQIFSRIGATDKFVFKREPSDYQAHNLGEKILDWLRGKVDDPQSKLLSEILTELEIPEDFKARPREVFKAGDILVMQHGSLFHMPVIYDDDLHFVNALPRLGVVEGTIQDATYNTHLVAAFRLKPK